MSRAPRTITLGRATINCRCHVCAFFHSREDEYNVLMPFMLQDLGRSGERRGIGATRLWANMEWALVDYLGADDTLEYESRVNDIVPKYDMAAVCSYDLSKSSAALMVDV